MRNRYGFKIRVKIKYAKKNDDTKYLHFKSSEKQIKTLLLFFCFSYIDNSNSSFECRKKRA